MDYLPGLPGESFPQMFLSTSGLDSIDDTLVHTNISLSELQIRIHWLAGWVHTVHHGKSADALQKQMPDLIASTAPTVLAVQLG